MKQIKMKAKIEKRYRISDTRGWYFDFESQSGAVKLLAQRLRLELSTFRIYEVKPNKDIPDLYRTDIIRSALIHLAESLRY